MPLTSNNVAALVSECILMKRANDHPNIVRYLNAFQACLPLRFAFSHQYLLTCLINQVDGKLWVAMEFMAGGCLADALACISEKSSMSEEHIAWICKEVLQHILAKFKTQFWILSVLCRYCKG